MSIKQKLITILLCAGLIPTLVVGVVAYIIIGNQLRSTASSQLVSIAIKQQETINTLLQNEQEQVEQLGNRYDFQVALSDYDAHKDASDLATINTIIQTQQLADPTEIEAISVAQPNGSILASTVSTPTPASQHLPAQALSSIKAGNDNAITVSEDPTDGLDKLHITSVITVNNQEAGILDVTWTLQDIIAALQDYTGLGQTGETLIAAQNGKGQAIALFPLRFDTNAALKTNLGSLHLFNSNNPTTYSGVYDYRHHLVTVAERQVGFANWVIATKIDNQEIFAPIEQLKNSLGIIAILSSLVIIVIAWYLGRFFTRPVLHIARTAGRIGKGDFLARTSVRQNDELGALGTSINAMGENLRQLVTRIEAQRNQLQIILNSTVDSIIALDKNGIVIIANQATAELAGAAFNTLIGKHMRELFVWTKDGKPVQIDYSLPGTRAYNDLEYRPSSNTLHHVKVLVSQVVGVYEQTEAHAIITIHDETKTRELEAMKVDFVSMAAHELRTPLAAIRGYIELIKYQEASRISTQGVSYLEHAHKSTTELGGLINNLLDVTRIERGTLALHMDKLDLAATAYQSVQDAHFNAQEKHVTLTYVGPKEGCLVLGDDIAVHEIINNLVSNAIKYTPEGGKVNVTLIQQSTMYAVSVQDTGSGIPKAALPNLFTKFYRVHGGLDSGNTGTGLGLFISKSIAERHHGTITVQSEEGKGSTFTFIIPLLSQVQLDAAKQSEQHPLNVRSYHGWSTKNITR